jgi:hypothetical protein
MHLIYGGFAVFILTALPLLILGRSVGTEVLVFGGGLFAMVLVIVAATTGLWRFMRLRARRR